MKRDRLEGELNERERAEDLFKTLAHSSPVGIFIVQDNKFCYVNPSFQNVTGYGEDKLLGRDSLGFVFAEDRDMLREDVIKMLKGKLSSPNQFRVIHKNGGIRWVMESVNSIQYRGRQATLGSYMDITERKQIDEQLRQSEAKYSALVEHSNDGIIIIQDGLVKFANAEMVAMTGFSLDEVFDRPFIDFVSPEYQALVMERYQQRISGAEVPNKYEIEIMARDGSRLAVEISASRIEYEGGAADMAIVRDITERRRAEDALRQSEERYHSLFDNTNDVIQSVLPDGHFLYVNKAWCNVLGYSEGEVANLNLRDIIHPDSMDHCMETFQRVMSGEKVSDIEATFVAKDGSSVAVAGNAHARFVDGKPVSTQGIFRDITAHKGAEGRIVHLNALLRALRDVNQLITRELDRGRLIQQSCDILVRTRGYEQVWILLADGNRKPLFVAEAGLGEESQVFMELLRTGKYPYCVEQLWKQKSPLLAYNKPGVRHKKCVLSSLHRSRGVYRYRLEYEGKVYGVLGATTFSQAIADEEEKDLFLELCGDISFALANIERREERQRVMAALRESEQRYRVLIENLPQKIFYKDKGLVYVSCNQNYSRDVKTTPEEIAGKTDYDFFPEELAEKYRADDRRIIESGKTEILEEAYIEEGQGRTVETFKTPVWDEKGNVVGVLGIFHDITERKKREEVLRKERDRAQNYLDIAGVIIVAIDSGGRVTLINRKGCQVLGYKEEDIIGKSWFDNFVPARIRSELLAVSQKLLSPNYDTESMSFYENPILTKSGEERVIVWHNTVLKDDKGNIIGHLSSGEDITSRKQAEEALQQSEEKLRLMFETIPEGITVLDRNGIILQANKATASLYGYDNKEEIYGRNILEFVAEKDHAKALEAMKNTPETGNLGAMEFTQLRKDRSEFPTEVSGSVLKDASGKPIGLVTITEDITERKQMEEQLMVTDRLASVGELASGIAHELNNPLTGVIGLSELLLEKDVPGQIGEDLEAIRSEAQRAARVVKNLLTFARKHPESKEPVSINKVIEKVLALRAYEHKVNNIRVDVHLEPDLPKIVGDSFQLQQVFLNVVINAEFFMTQAHNRGTLTINTEKRGDLIRAAVTDDGPGISREDLRHLFAPFFTTKEVGKGTGLGLSICHGIVTAHNGQMYAESELGKGATFIIELPLEIEGD